MRMTETRMERGEWYGELRIVGRQGNRRRIAERHWEDANTVVSRAVRCGVLERAGIGDAGGSKRSPRWAAVNHDIYGIAASGRLVLVQDPHASNNKYGPQVQISYYVTDGDLGVEIQNGTKSLVKRAAKADPAPDSPLRALRHLLPDDWQKMVNTHPVSYPSPATESGYKLLERDEGGVLRSLWDSDYTYALGRRQCNAARRDHGGGLYYYASREECESMKGIDWGREITDYVIVRCEVSGTILRYESGKRAATYLRPVEIV